MVETTETGVNEQEQPVAATLEQGESEPETEAETEPEIGLEAPKPVRKKGGRPPKQEAAPPKDVAKYFPAPPTRVFQDSNSTPRLKVQGFIDYAKRVCTDARFSGRPYFTVYRLWPVINRDIQGKKRQIDNTDKYLDSIQDLYHRYGSGDYSIYMSDGGGGPSRRDREVCRCFVKQAQRNLNEDPPVLDLEDLVVTDPANASYLQWRRIKGLPVPGEDPQPKNGEEEMSKEVVSELLGQNRELMGRVVELSQEPHYDKEPNGRGGGVDAAAGRAVLDVVTAGAKTAIEMTQSAASKINEAQAQQANPVQMVSEVVGMVRGLMPEPAPPKDDTVLLGIISELRADKTRLEERLADESRARMDAIEARLAQQAASVVATQPKSFVAELEERVKVNKLMKEFNGTEEEEEETGLGGKRSRSGSEPWYAPFVPLLVPVGMFAISSVSSMVHNMAVAKTGQGAPQAPPAVPAEALPPEVRAQLSQASTGQPGAIGGASTPGSPGGQPLSAAEQEMNQIRMFIQTIKQPILTHLNDPEATGHDFASWMINGYGMVTYKQVTGGEKAKDEIITAIRSHAPDLWDLMQRMGVAADQFLDEFIAGPPLEDETES